MQLQGSASECAPLPLQLPCRGVRPAAWLCCSPPSARCAGATAWAQSQDLHETHPLSRILSHLIYAPHHSNFTLPLRVMTIRFSPSFPVTVLTVANMSMALMMPSPNSCSTGSGQGWQHCLAAPFPTTSQSVGCCRPHLVANRLEGLSIVHDGLRAIQSCLMKSSAALHTL